MADQVQILTTAESREDAYALAQNLIHDQLATSAQVAGPIVSIFMQGSAMVEAQQWQLVLRTTAAQVSAVREIVSASEFVVVPVLDGDAE
ncbi:divalent cation tolerance protein CutA [Nonomuraea endophytica]|uniref:Periplasmic divalent cation tolerance protein n=1 Tax=Nonomuraea endophytica TaxID=714136 RepID=A0A7W8ACV0_9ACTN|nr:divalent cation tolerance protein CutA [Nonomuraea endophytica]MBB5083773.1 periplasmic divalent cation tolerance protein [Nonomuraea endophytica]